MLIGEVGTLEERARDEPSVVLSLVLITIGFKANRIDQ